MLIMAASLGRVVGVEVPEEAAILLMALLDWAIYSSFSTYYYQRLHSEILRESSLQL
ncbi:MAG: hypothetical protein J7L91_03795 [Candidatus Korarchaeota archaeon]|nr:hypothetical protein [Candidatus Korarchaeota archaeon]